MGNKPQFDPADEAVTPIGGASEPTSATAGTAIPWTDPSVYLALLIPLLALGFWPHYLSKLTGSRLTIHIHGVGMMGWVMLLVAQARFAAIDRLRLHRTVGRAGFVVGPAVIVSAGLVCREMLRHNGPGVSQQELLSLVLPLGGLALFTAAWGAALWFRHQPALHKRYMVLTAVALMGAGVDRVLLFYVAGFDDALSAAHGNFVIAELVCIVLIGNDWRLGRVRTPFVVGLLGFGLNHALLSFYDQWRWWRTVAEAVAS